MSRILFVYDNLKVTLNPGDAPYYGFDILAGEAQCSAQGTLFDLGLNAGFSLHGRTEVKGQVWTAQSPDLIEELREFAYPKGNVRLESVFVTIVEDKEKLVVPATIFAVDPIPHWAREIQSGYWTVRNFK